MTYGGSVLMKIHESGEDYLEAIFVLQQKKGMVRSVDVAQHLGVKKPSVNRKPAGLSMTSVSRASRN